MSALITHAKVLTMLGKRIGEQGASLGPGVTAMASIILSSLSLACHDAADDLRKLALEETGT